MTYSEAAYFDRIPVAHCAAWQDHLRLRRIADACARLARQALARPTTIINRKAAI